MSTTDLRARPFRDSHTMGRCWGKYGVNAGEASASDTGRERARGKLLRRLANLVSQGFRIEPPLGFDIIRAWRSGIDAVQDEDFDTYALRQFDRVRRVDREIRKRASARSIASLGITVVDRLQTAGSVCALATQDRINQIQLAVDAERELAAHVKISASNWFRIPLRLFRLDP